MYRLNIEEDMRVIIRGFNIAKYIITPLHSSNKKISMTIGEQELHVMKGKKHARKSAMLRSGLNKKSPYKHGNIN